MDEDDKKLRRAATLINEVAGVALSVSQPLSFGRKIVELLLRLHAGEPVPGLPAYFLDWLNDIQLDQRALQERLFALESDYARQIVVGNYGEQAWREANEERRKMLGDAVLGVIVSDLDATDLSRAERTIRMLDPGDLETLKSVAEIENTYRQLSPHEIAAAQRGGHSLSQPQYLLQTLLAGHLEGAALVASGCVVVEPSGPVRYDVGVDLGARVTPIGRLVLRFLGRHDTAGQ